MTGASASPGTAFIGPAVTGAARSPRWWDTAASELRKLRTLRSTFWTLLVAWALVIGFCLLATFLAGSQYGQHGNRAAPIDLVSGSWTLGFLAFMVMGVMVITNEYATGLAVATFMATPRRLRVWTAKLAVFGGMVLGISLVLTFVQFFIGQAVLSLYKAVPPLSLHQNDILRVVIGYALYNTLITLMGMAVGALVRQTAGAIAVIVGFWLVLPLLFLPLPDSWKNPLSEYWPTEAGKSVVTLSPGPHTLTAWWGIGEFALFVAVLLALAGFAIVRRDP